MLLWRYNPEVIISNAVRYNGLCDDEYNSSPTTYPKSPEVRFFIMKLLILYTDYGTGHRSAAKALSSVFNNTDNEILLLNPLNLSKPLIDEIFRRIGIRVATKHRSFCKNFFNERMYKLTGKSKFTDFCAYYFWSDRLGQEINKFNPDIVISTQVGPAYAMTKWKSRIKNSPNLATVFTDYGVHNWHIIGHKKIDYYFIPTKQIKNQLVKFGVQGDKIHITGIPVDKKFHPKQKSVNKKLEILFIAGGGQGYDNSLPYFQELLKINKPFSCTFVAGKNTN